MRFTFISQLFLGDTNCCSDDSNFLTTGGSTSKQMCDAYRFDATGKAKHHGNAVCGSVSFVILEKPNLGLQCLSSSECQMVTEVEKNGLFK